MYPIIEYKVFKFLTFLTKSMWIESKYVQTKIEFQKLTFVWDPANNYKHSQICNEFKPLAQDFID